MTGYIIQRLMQCVIVLLLITLLIFIVIRALPSDPLMIFITENELRMLLPEEMKALRHEFGLDKQPMQYIDWMDGILIKLIKPEQLSGLT